MVLRGQTAHPPWKGKYPLRHDKVQTPQLLMEYPVAQTHMPLEMTWFDPQVKQFPLASRISSLWHWLTQLAPWMILP
jgi:hypothetical protein